MLVHTGWLIEGPDRSPASQPAVQLSSRGPLPEFATPVRLLSCSPAPRLQPLETSN